VKFTWLVMRAVYGCPAPSGGSTCKVTGGCAAMITGVLRNQSSRNRCSVTSGVAAGVPGAGARAAALGSPGVALGAGAENTPEPSDDDDGLLAQALRGVVHTLAPGFAGAELTHALSQLMPGVRFHTSVAPAAMPAGVSARYPSVAQPGGANAGPIFVNPPGDSAGRLIEACGPKGPEASMVRRGWRDA